MVPAFDGSSTHQGGGVGIVLYAPDGTSISLSFKLEFFCTNNEAGYEAPIIELTFTLGAGVHRLRVEGDSELTIKHVKPRIHVEGDCFHALSNYRSETD